MMNVENLLSKINYYQTAYFKNESKKLRDKLVKLIVRKRLIINLLFSNFHQVIYLT